MSGCKVLGMLDETKVKKLNINTIAHEKFHVLCNNFDPFFNWNLTTTQAFFIDFILIASVFFLQVFRAS